MIRQIKQEQLTAYLAGELPWWRRFMVRRAIRRNAETRHLFRELEAVWWKLDEWHAPTPSDDMPDRFRRAFRDEFGRSPAAVPQSRPRRVGVAPGWALVATAAVAVIMVAYSNGGRSVSNDPLVLERPESLPVRAATTASKPAASMADNMMVASVPTMVASAPLPSPTAGNPDGIIRMGERPIQSHHSVVPMPVVSQNNHSYTVGLQGVPASSGLAP